MVMPRAKYSGELLLKGIAGAGFEPTYCEAQDRTGLNQERNRDREDSDGRPDRMVEEIQEWAVDHNLPCDDEGRSRVLVLPATAPVVAGGAAAKAVLGWPRRCCDDL
jgi:hypothetical protein